MNLFALPAFADNYIWMIRRGCEALVVDPGDAAPVHLALKQHGLKLSAILVTHHHGDHVGGLPDLKSPDIPVYGPGTEGIQHLTYHVAQGDVVRWQGLEFHVHDVGGHTRGHLAYLCEHFEFDDGVAPLAFVGDTLFSAGCGRVFDGTLPQLHASIERIKQWPAQTRLCPAHEYTLSNLRFAQAVEPDNKAVHQHMQHCQALRDAGLPTLPTALSTELGINPFLRCSEATVMAAALNHGAEQTDPVSVFSTLRLWKNTF